VSDHEVELRDTLLSQPGFRVAHHLAAKASASGGRVHCQVVDSPAVPVVTSHDSRDHCLPVESTQDGRRGTSDRPVEVVGRIVPWPGELGCVPEGDGSSAVCNGEMTGLHRGSLLDRPDWRCPKRRDCDVVRQSLAPAR
jgi:hypothetical protein